MKNDYPKLFIDTKYITEIRKKAQKQYKDDEFLAFYFLRKFSIYITLLINKVKFIKPNHVTVFMLFSAFLIPIIGYVFTENLRSFVTIMFLCLMFTYSLDVIDGELARLSGIFSKNGLFYDASLWYAYPFMYMLFCIRAFELSLISNAALIALLALVVFNIYIFSSFKIFNPASKSQMGASGIALLKFCIGRSGVIIFLFIIGFFKLKYFNHLSIAAVALSIVSYFIYDCRRLFLLNIS